MKTFLEEAQSKYNGMISTRLNELEMIKYFEWVTYSTFIFGEI